MTKTEQIVVDCLECPHDSCNISDHLHRHFEALPPGDWINAAEEARHMTNILAERSDEILPLMKDSIQDHILYAATAKAHIDVCRFLARWFGLDEEATEIFIIERIQSEHADTRITPERFFQCIRDCEAWLKALKDCKTDDEVVAVSGKWDVA